MAAEPVRDNVVSFSTTATRELVQDLIQITLQARQEGPVAADVQAQLKQQLEAALVEARKAAVPGGMDVRTGGFHLSPRYTNNGRVNGWQGQAQLVLEGTDMARISQTAGKLNALQITSVSYGLSRALRESQESELTSQAIARFRERAQRIAADFGQRGFSLGEVSVSSTDPGFEGRPVLMAARAKTMEMMADAPVPVEPGKGTLSVTVSGQVRLTP
ncbi:SIMPL domain-containing protein [Aquabacterium olei]|uniref:SIMPL domain-containing protein n=2 Tax=Aquabacterium olei TaxID=1296669 RepID=A0A2U8FVW3_9BURK|nr:SIMPL domain-containing protein [Aquabacterium olei]